MNTSTIKTPPPAGVASAGAASQWQIQLANQTRAEHDALLVAMHGLEAAAAAAARGREHPWNDRVLDNLRKVHLALREHMDSAEGPDGLFAEIDLCRPTLVRRVEQLRSDHARMLEQCAALVTMAEKQCQDECPPFADVRRQAMNLLNCLRRHQATEADLIFESFYTDIGAGD